MRLVCPNCSAQYEIELTAIPDEGRDVQCSNCGHTWFELPPPPVEFNEPLPDEEDTAVAAIEPQETDDLSEAEDAQPSQAAMAIAAASEESAGDGDTDDDEFLAPPVGETRLKPRRPADAADLDILREEAEREMSQRRAPPSEQIETQTDLGLDDLRNRNSPSRALRARMASPKTEPDPKPDPRTTSQSDVVSEESYQAPRKDLLPDIDEINSTLKSTKKRVTAAPETIARQRKGFRSGFLLMILACVALILVYARAPAIARVVPSAETAILTYVDKANAVRDWLDGLVGRSGG